MLPVFAITVIVVIVNLVRHPGLHSAWLVVFMVAAALAVLKTRHYALKVQDRVIRLEERLRMAILLDKPLRARITELRNRSWWGCVLPPMRNCPPWPREPCQKNYPEMRSRRPSPNGGRTTGECENNLARAGTLAPTFPSLLLGFVQLLGQIILQSHFADGVQLPFQPVDVLFFVGQNSFQQIA